MTESTSPPSQDRAPLPRSVWVLSWVSFFADVSGEMIYPLLPLFLVGALGATKAELGVLEGGALLLVAVMSATAGIRSDGRGGRTRRVPWIRWGYGLPVLGKALIGLAGALPLALGGRLLDRFGKGLRGAPRDALIADAVSEDQHGRAFGLHRALDTAGAFTGVSLAALLLWWLGARATDDGAALGTSASVYRTVILIGAALGLVSLALTFLVREAPPDAHGPSVRADDSPRREAQVESGERPSTTPLPRSYWAVLAVLLLFALANSSDTFLLLRASDLGLSPVAVVLLYAAFNASYSLLAYPAGVWSDRLGRWRVIALGWTLYIGVYAGFAFVGPTDAWAVWPLMFVYGAYMALTDGIGKALIADHVPRARRGAAMGLFYGSLGLCGFTSSVLTGVLWDRYGPEAAFALGAGFAALALVGLGWMRWRRLDATTLTDRS